MNIHMM